MNLTREQLEKWQEYLVGKDCPKHPGHIIKDGKYGLWCGIHEFNGWCDGGFCTQEWLDNLKKGIL